MSSANAVAAVENFWREVWQPPQNPDAIDHLVAEDFVLTSGGIDFVSRARFKEWVIDFQSRITELQFDIIETFQNAEGTRVASRWQIRGKNNGLLGTEPDQRDIRFTGAAVWAVRHDGVLLHNWVERSAWELHLALVQPSGAAAATAAQNAGKVSVSMIINGESRTLVIEPRTTLLEALRSELMLTGPKMGCDRGECGACTVHVEGRRILSCMALAAMQEGRRITTIEALEQEGALHPVQAAFIEHDGFQCGFCTSGQIMSAVAMLEEAKAGWPSAATADIGQAFTVADLSDAEIRERMSGNLCRCACYPNIVDAIAEVAGRR